jgi:hypothetical protein
MKEFPRPVVVRDDDGKTPHERFAELGRKVMAVPKAEVVALEKKWQTRKLSPRKKTR